MISSSIKIILLLGAISGVHAGSSGSQVRAVAASIEASSKLQRYCWDWLNETPSTHFTVRAVTTTTTIKGFKTDYDTKTVTETVTPLSTVSATSTQTAVVTSTKVVTTTGNAKAKRGMPTANPLASRDLKKPPNEPSPLNRHSDSVVLAACRRVFDAKDVTKTMTETITNTVFGDNGGFATVTATRVKHVTMTETTSSMPTTVVVSTSTTSSTTTKTSTAAATQTAYSFGVRSFSSSSTLTKAVKLVAGTGYLTYGSGSDSFAFFTQTSASPLSGYFTLAADSTVCLDVDTYGGAVKFISCPAVPKTFYLDGSFVYPSSSRIAVDYPPFGSDSTVAFDQSSSTYGLTWQAGNDP